MNSRGYKPHVARELLDLPEQTLRYWKERLDPKPSRSHYSANVLLAYRIIRAIIENLRIPPSQLMNLGTKAIFEFCSSCTYEEIARYYLLISIEEQNLEIKPEDQKFDIRDFTLSHLYLDKIVEEHFQSFIRLGCSTKPS